MENNTFESMGLSSKLKEALTSLRYYRPTEVQKAVIPTALEEKDIIIESQTGTGKTAAFGIPLCEKVIWEENKPQALIIVPTRELALQIQEEIMNIGRLKRIKVTAVFGKSSFKTQKSELKQKSHIVVGTPGRVLEHLTEGSLNVEKVRTLVLDEADEMLNMGFIDQVEAIIDYLPTERQTMLFSATVPSEIERLAFFYLNKDHLSIKIEKSEDNTPNINQLYLYVRNQEKEALLLDLLTVENSDACIIFCNTRDTVELVNNYLAKENVSIDKLHGGMYQDDRLEVMQDFRQGKFRYLIATDLAARGIDIDNVTHVINYDVPYKNENFIHRTGRTGRAGKTGVALTLISQDDEKRWQEVREYTFNKQNVPQEITKPNERLVARSKKAFQNKQQEKPKVNKARNKDLNRGITKVYFNGGKKKKLRAVDFVGTLTSIKGILAEDIGIITIQENVTYVEILNNKGQYVIEQMQNRTIKGKQLKVRKARK